MAVSFATNGSNYIDAGSGTTIHNLSAWTYVLWFYPTDLTAGNYGLLGIGTFGAQTRKNLLIVTGTPDQMIFSADRATSDMACTSTGTDYTVNTWHFTAAAWDGGAGSPKIYDGSLTALATESGSYTTQTAGSGTIGDSSAQNIYVGNIGNPVNSLIGSIGVAMIFNRELSLGEIRSLQFRPRPLSGCVLFYRPSSTTSVPDWSGNGNTGTVTNGSLAADVPLGPWFEADTIWTPYTVAASFVPFPRPRGMSAGMHGLTGGMAA